MTAAATGGQPRRGGSTNSAFGFACRSDEGGGGGLAEAVVERVAGAAHRADRIGVVAAIERLAQAAHMHVDGAFVDIDVRAPHAFEHLLAGKNAAGPLHQEL